MFRISRVASLIGSVAVTAALCSAQSITSAHSGTVHYFEGDVSVDGAPVQAKTGRFTEIKEQGVLRTGLGRAEILLTPGVFLRVGENSAIKLLDNRLVSTRVDLMSGSFAIESDDPQMSLKDSPVTLTYKDYDIRVVKFGLVEISTDPALLKVYKGEALVQTADSNARVKEGHELPFSAALLTEKFNDKVGDDLYLWSRDRSQSLSAASMASARSVNTGLNGGGYGYLSSGLGVGPGAWNGGWYFNPYLGMYTFLSGGDMFLNAFGYGFFSPYTIYNYYSPSTYWYGGGGPRGATTIGRTLYGSTNPARGTVPLATLRGGASSNTGGLPALGSPARTGGVLAAGAGGLSGRAAGFQGMANPNMNSGPAGFGGGASAASAVSASRGGGAAMSAGGGAVTGGHAGGGGGASAAGARGR